MPDDMRERRGSPARREQRPRPDPAGGPMIPGERDPSNLTHREPGAVSGQFTGGDIPPDPVPWVDEPARRELIREGGGADAERHRDEQRKAKRET